MLTKFHDITYPDLYRQACFVYNPVGGVHVDIHGICLFGVYIQTQLVIGWFLDNVRFHGDGLELFRRGGDFCRPMPVQPKVVKYLETSS